MTLISVGVHAAAPTTVPIAAVNPGLPTLWIIGDSTVHNGGKDEVGWGEPIQALFDKTRINVANRAMGGRSSRTFRTDGRWDQILGECKPGDFVIMQFGHNDGGPYPATTESAAPFAGSVMKPRTSR